MAVIALDFSAQATCPRDNPYSLAQTLTQCSAPRPFFRSWLRRAVLPSMAKTGRSTPVAAAAASRSAVSQVTKQAWKAVGGSVMRTRRKTSLLGTPCGRSRRRVRRSCLVAAQAAMAVGPPAPASTARKAMTRTLGRGWRRLTVERGSSRS
jgi:hypothetical protein